MSRDSSVITKRLLCIYVSIHLAFYMLCHFFQPQPAVTPFYVRDAGWSVPVMLFPFLAVVILMCMPFDKATLSKSLCVVAIIGVVNFVFCHLAGMMY